MGYLGKSLNDLRDEALEIAREHGFKDASIPEDLALMHSEISEALEDYRDGRQPNDVFYLSKPDGTEHEEMYGSPDDQPRKPCGIPSEMADIIIRVLHFCGKHDIDIDRAVREKMEYNDSRPYKHGKIL